MAAASFSKILSKSIQVKLVESDQISTIGVGEATVPPLILFNQYIGTTEQEFLTAVKGTIKLGISFENWLDVNQDYIHSFGSVGKDTWAAGFQHYWRKGLDIGINEPLSDYCLEYQAALAQKFSHLPNSGIHYAYHLDACCYAKFLRKIAEANGAKRIEGKVVDVALETQSGSIQSIRLASGEIIEGDLLIAQVFARY